MATNVFDVIVVGGGPIGLAAAYEVAKAGSKVIVLEQNNFFNHAGSSNDLARMFRTMYTEDFMADLAKQAMDFWDNLEKDSGISLRWMTGLLNFGDKNYGENTPEGTLLGPIDNLERLGMPYSELNADEIEDRYPFKDLLANWAGLYAPDNGIINVQLLLRTLLRLAKGYGAEARQHTHVKHIRPSESDSSIWEVYTTPYNTDVAVVNAKKIILASGSYINHVLKSSFQFAPDKGGRSQLFYGFPTLPWGPANITRVAVDAATRRIKDPSQRLTNVLNPEDIRDAQEFVKEHVVGVDSTIPSFNSSCLQTNVFDNMFVLDYVPPEYLRGGPKDSVVVFTAGWAMKFVPLLGKALAEMSLNGSSEYARQEFSITRSDPNTGNGIIIDSSKLHTEAGSSFGSMQQASGSSIKGLHNTAYRRST